MVKRETVFRFSDITNQTNSIITESELIHFNDGLIVVNTWIDYLNDKTLIKIPFMTNEED